MAPSAARRWSLRARLAHRAWRYRLRTERAEVAFVRRHLSTGHTAIDVGAHRGAFTYWMLRAVGPTGHVVASEPIPALAVYLKRLSTDAGYDRLHVIDSALSDQPGTALLHVPSAGYLGTATLVDQAAGHTAVRVTTTTLDDLSVEHRLGAIRLIKCDVEGHELDVLRGAKRVLEDDRPVLLVESVDDRPAPGQTRRLFDFLERLGYCGYFFEEGRLVSIAQFQVERHQAGPAVSWHVNFGFVPAETGVAGG